MYQFQGHIYVDGDCSQLEMSLEILNGVVHGWRLDCRERLGVVLSDKKSQHYLVTHIGPQIYILKNPSGLEGQYRGVHLNSEDRGVPYALHDILQMDVRACKHAYDDAMKIFKKRQAVEGALSSE
jgi:hypothetical protein